MQRQWWPGQVLLRKRSARHRVAAMGRCGRIEGRDSAADGGGGAAAECSSRGRKADEEEAKDSGRPLLIRTQRRQLRNSIHGVFRAASDALRILAARWPIALANRIPRPANPRWFRAKTKCRRYIGCFAAQLQALRFHWTRCLANHRGCSV